MPTLRAMRRRGYTPEAVLDFIRRVGVAKNYSISDVSLLEACVRDDLNKHAFAPHGCASPAESGH